MTPNTFEAIAVQGVVRRQGRRAEWRVGAGYFDKIKERNSDDFVSDVGGRRRADGVERGVYVGRRQLQDGPTSRSARSTTTATTSSTSSTPKANTTLPLGEKHELRFAAAVLRPAERRRQPAAGRRFLAPTSGAARPNSALGRRAVDRGVHQRRRRHQHAESVERLSGLHQRAGRGLQPRRRGRLDAARRLQLSNGAGPQHLRAVGQRLGSRSPASSRATNTTSTCSGRRTPAR